MMDGDLFLNGTSDLIPIKVVHNKSLNHKIYWSFDTVSVAGEIGVWGGFVFDQSTYCLNSIYFHVSEDNFNGECFLRKLLESPVITGLPCVKNNTGSLANIEVYSKYLTRDGRYLLCITPSKVEYQEKSLLCVKIHERLNMVFVDDIHCGFILEDPFRSLVRFAGFSEEKVDADTPINLSRFLDVFLGYFDLMNSLAWSMIENGCSETYDKLKLIQSNLAKANLTLEPFYALWEQCERLLSDIEDSSR